MPLTMKIQLKKNFIVMTLGLSGIENYGFYKNG